MNLRHVAFLLGASLFATHTHGQGTLPPAAQTCFDVAYVEPDQGNDATGAVNDPTKPFRTINTAILAVESILSGSQEGLVACMPGIYSRLSNGEIFPILMKSNVHVRGAGARETVIRGDQTQFAEGQSPYQDGIFIPVPPVGLRFVNAVEVLVDFSLCLSELSTTFSGFTLQGGNVQAYCENEPSAARFTIHDTIFDMLQDAPDVHVPGPLFGFLNVSILDNPGAGYGAAHINLLNNTVIMGWHFGEDNDEQGQLFCLPGAVGFCDVTDEAGHTPDPPSLKGVSDMNVQNNIIRTLHVATTTVPSQPTVMALLGIDNSDTSVAVGSRLGPTNVFDQNLVGGSSMLFSSAILTTPPIPWIDVNPLNPAAGTGSGVARDPAFVGESLSRRFGAGNPHLIKFRDWRLLPDSALIDQGSSPVIDPITLAPTFVAVSGQDYVPSGCPDVDAFSRDMEQDGNPRVVAMPPVVGSIAEVDIGADEVHAMIATAAYANDSDIVGFSAPSFFPPVWNQNTGMVQRRLIFPDAGTANIALTMDISWTSNDSWVHHPTLAPPTTLGGLPIGFDQFHLDVFGLSGISVLPIFTTGALAVGMSPPYLAPFETLPAQSHFFGELVFPVAFAGGLTEGLQAGFIPTNLPTGALLSNAQNDRF